MDYSSMSDLLSCPRKYELRQIKGLGGGDTMATRWGTFWHKVQELWGSGEYKDDYLCVEAAAEAVKWTDVHGDFHTLVRMKSAFNEWLEKYKNQPLNVKFGERPFVIDLDTSPPLQFEGVIDAIADCSLPEVGQVRAVVDYKTTGRLALDWRGLYRNSNQFRFYYLAARYLGVRTDGVLVDIYHCTKGNKKQKTTGNEFYREFYQFTGSELFEAKEDFLKAGAAAEIYKMLGHYPKNTSACQSYGTTCAFLDVCLASGQLREDMENSMPKATHNVKELLIKYNEKEESKKWRQKLPLQMMSSEPTTETSERQKSGVGSSGSLKDVPESKPKQE